MIPKEVHYAPSMSMESLCNLRDTVGEKKANEKPIVALVFLYGSWNSPSSMITSPAQQPQWNQNFLQTLLGDATRGRQKDSTFLVCGALQVDQDDETMACCLGDDNFHDATDSKNYSLPCPPATLPALAVAIQNFPQNHGRLQYVSDISSVELLSQMLSLSSSDIIAMGKKVNLDEHVRSEWTASVQSVMDDLLTQEVISNMSNATAKTNENQVKKRPIASLEPPIGKGEHQPLEKVDEEGGTADCLRIFVAGDRSSVGKSSVCLGLIGTLLHKFGYAPSSLAYIKPATQCEAPQLVQAYCEAKGIACRAIGPLVYYKGFTRAFLAGETGQTSQDLLTECGQAVDEIAQGKRIVLIDGVGFPAVGSICGTDNASVAKACGYPTPENTFQRRPPGVIVVGGSGVGAAVDAFNLNATYFEMSQVPVMGGIFNKLSTEGYYSLENCKQQLTTYFQHNEHQQRHDRVAFGFVPLFDGLGDSDAIKHVDEYIEVFGEHVNIPTILEKARGVKQHYSEDNSMDIDSPLATMKTETSHTGSSPLKKRFKPSGVAAQDSSISDRAKLSRSDIERSAARQGAATA